MNRIDLSTHISPDKSSLIRGYLFSLLTDEPVSVYYSYTLPNDVKTAYKCLKLFKKEMSIQGDRVVISGESFKPEKEINCENSATVMHLLMGIAALKKWKIELTGDSSLMSRNHDDFIQAGKLYENGYVETVLSKESAQLKSYHLIAMLNNGGKLNFKSETRRNTEVLLKKMGAEIVEGKNSIKVSPVKKLNGYDLEMKLDPSASFIAACMALVLKKKFVISGIYPEKSRMEPFQYLKKAGYSVCITLKESGYEVTGTSDMKTGSSEIVVSNGDVPSIIDEIPFIAYMIARTGNSFKLENGEWLRNKETDRISETVKRINMFFETIETKDGFIVNGGKEKNEWVVHHSDDHRMEMLSKLTSVDKNITYTPVGSYRVSFPGFLDVIFALGGI